jgi:predicted metal-dependent phosphoesterase TrpH
MRRFDLHTHSTCSDGELAPGDLVHEAVRRGLGGISVTDHNGVWGWGDAQAAAHMAKIDFVAGIEVSAAFQGFDVHILGYSRNFDVDALESGLAGTRKGYAARMQAMVKKCQMAGYDRVSWKSIHARRSWQHMPVYVSLDLVRELSLAHGLPLAEAHAIVLKHSYLPYGDWALTPSAAVDLIHQAHGKAVLAHPGIISHEHGRQLFSAMWQQLRGAGIDGVEIYHPFHSQAVTRELAVLANEEKLFVTGGSDWHGSSLFALNNEKFGAIGLSIDEYTIFLGNI